MYEGVPYFISWLKKPSGLHTVLLEVEVLVSGVPTTLYMSTKAHYVSKPTDTPANTAYPAIARVGVLYTEQISVSVSGDASLSAGEIDISNHNGVRDAWVDYIWTNAKISAYIGDPTWSRGQFQPVFVGVIADISHKDSETLVLKLRDKMQLLNTPVTDAKVGGSGQNKDAPAPVLLGEVRNFTPVAKDLTTLTYQAHLGLCAGPIEVRDGAIPIAVTFDNNTGTFALAHQSFGNITMSAQGDATGGYTNRIGPLVQRLITNYGNRAFNLGPADIDTANFAQFDATFAQPVGQYITDRVNLIEACKQFAGSVGAQLLPSRLGLFRLVQLKSPDGQTPVMDVYENMIYDFAPKESTTPVGAVKLGYCKNWTVQTDLTDRIPQAHRDLYAQEWYTVTKVSATVQAQRKLAGEPAQQDTMLLRGTDASAEAQRRLDLWKVPRGQYEFTAVRELLRVEVGQVIRVWYKRYGMVAGKLATVTSLQPDWETAKVKVGILV